MSQQILTNVSRYVIRDSETLRKEPSIVGTKVMVRDIVEVWKSGVAPEQISAQLFNLISAAQVFDAIGFYLDNQSEIDDYIQWYRNHPMLNVPTGLRLNPLKSEVDRDIMETRSYTEADDRPEHSVAS